VIHRANMEDMLCLSHLQGDLGCVVWLCIYLSMIIVLRKLVVYGFKEPANEPGVHTFMQQCFVGIRSIAAASKLYGTVSIFPAL